ncbi:vacuolar segregation subunit 7-domain-containing protein [Whalleya microplaca]|nr:vacuolar segregation subunit 7-domain-containing protein [Whalleya microplaca]
MANNPVGMDASLSSLNSAENDTSAASSAHVDSQASKWTSASTSLTASPAQSRDPSPTRPTAPTAKTGRTSRASVTSTRSRKNSLQDPSPSRTKSSISNIPTPSSSSTPRPQLSSATTPSLPPPSASETVLRTPVPQKPSVAPEHLKDAPRWPISPRLRSPPPNIGRPTVASSRRSEQEPPVINVQRATPSPHVEPASSQSASDNEVEDPHLSSGMRTPARGPSNASSTLETVQEVSQPNTPRPELDVVTEKLAETAAAQSSSQAENAPVDAKKASVSAQTANNSESGSESGSMKTNKRRSSSAAPTPLLQSRQSSSALKFGSRGQPSGESSSRNMTVETELVDSVPQTSLVPGAGGPGGNGSLRTKPSSETIKPKKEKKKHRKPASVASGNGEIPTLLTAAKLRHSASIRSISSASFRSPTKLFGGQGSSVDEAIVSPRQRVLPKTRTPSITTHVANLLTRGPRPASSKADIFEAKVASAVEEANSSDSDETFVYDSNPPDAGDRPRRYHSRTPSTTSMASQVDRNGMRSIHTVLEGTTAPSFPVKKNMKFVNAYNSVGNENAIGDDDGRGTARSSAGSTRGTGRQHPHPGRWGRNNSSNHLSLFDNESPFPNAARSKLSGNNSRQTSNPTSPRFSASRTWATNSKRQMITLPDRYDFDDTTTGADDERTPLIPSGTPRSMRSSRSRRTHLRNVESQTYRQRPSFLNRFASCLVLTVMLLLVITGAIGFMFATSQPLTGIELMKISNVLASEQELMMDITVKAHNPNVVVIQIETADLEVFAKSPHAGTDSDWWRHPNGDLFDTLDDPKNDPPVVELPGDDSPDESSPNMRLGNILKFDSPLSYEGSFFQTGISTSTGGLRLGRPGNDTDGGSERWERIMSDDFTLIVKGVLKYTLPLSQRVRNVAISGKTTVKPNSANDPSLRPNETEIGIYR